MANAKVLAKKQDEVKLYKEKFEKSKLVILADYRGINVSDVKIWHRIQSYKKFNLKICC